MEAFLRKWCSRYWLIVEMCLGMIMSFLLIINWKQWNVPNKYACSIGIFISIHVIEEWILPGGFHYQYNLHHKSSIPDRYPMNQESDMLTNLGGIIFFSILTFIPLNNGIVALAFVFGLGETAVHTKIGMDMKNRFKNKGKRTFYGPGSITAYLYFFTISISALVYLFKTGFDLSCLITLILTFIICLGVFINGIEKVLMNPDTKYVFPSAKYFEKYIK